MMKKSSSVVLLFVGVLMIGCVLFYRSELGQTFLWKNVNQTQDMFVDCFVEAPVKCGRTDYSDKQIEEEIRFLKLTKPEVKELILKAQNYEIAKFDELIKKSALNDDERWRLEVSRESQKYYIRVLKVIDEME